MAKAKIRGLDCSAPAEQMIPVVLRAQFNAVIKHRAQALNWRDPEGVHDMRVLLRRLRSAIHDFHPYFRKRNLPRPKLRAIARRLGAVRDEDVALIALKELISQAEREAAAGIQQIALIRKERRTKARAALKNVIKEPALEELRRNFLAKLRSITIAVPHKNRDPQTAAVGPSFRALGVHVVNERMKDFTTASRCLYRPYQVNELHELRILAKRLRYSIELFDACWGKAAVDSAKEVAEMQTSLGELHDCDVWIDDLSARLKRIARKTKPEPHELEMRAGATWLLKHFAAERMRHYGDALGRWEQWQAEGFFEQLMRLLDADSLTAKSAPGS